MLAHVYKFLLEEDGPTAVEYAVMISLIAGAVFVSVQLLANNTAASFDNSATELASAMGS